MTERDGGCFKQLDGYWDTQSTQREKGGRTTPNARKDAENYAIVAVQRSMARSRDLKKVVVVKER